MTMADDGSYIASVGELIKEVNAALRRGYITGPIAQQINITINQIGGSANTPLSPRRVPVRFGVPRNFNLKTGVVSMASVGVRGDMGTKVPIEFDNISGSPVPEPSGTASVTSSDTSVANVRVDPNDPSSIDILPVQPPVEGKDFTVTFTLGSIVITGDFVVTPDLAATQGHFVTTEDTNFPLDTATP